MSEVSKQDSKKSIEKDEIKRKKSVFIQNLNSIKEIKKNKKFNVNLMGEVIYKGNKSYSLMKQIQMGLRNLIMEEDSSLKKSNEEVSIKEKDFSHKQKTPFPK
jgi:hypothetical protein